MKTYYLLNFDSEINSLCASFLDEDCFHQSVTVIDSDGKKKQYSAWRVTLLQLQTIYRNVRDKGISLKYFRVAVSRIPRSCQLRIAQKKEYIEGHQSIRKRPERLKEILNQRKR